MGGLSIFQHVYCTESCECTFWPDLTESSFSTEYAVYPHFHLHNSVEYLLEARVEKIETPLRDLDGFVASVNSLYPLLYVKYSAMNWNPKYYITTCPNYSAPLPPVVLFIWKEVKNSNEIAGFEIVFYTS